MLNIPTQRPPGLDQVYQTWAEAGLDPDSVVDLGDGASMTLRELLGESNDKDEE